MKPKLLLFILCDDIRFEEGNKKTLIGIYSKAIYVPIIPFTMPKLGFFIRLAELDIDRKYKLVFKIINLNEKENTLEIEEPKAKFHKGGNDLSDLNLLFSPVIFENEGDYKAILELTGEESFSFVYDFSVVLQPKKQ